MTVRKQICAALVAGIVCCAPAFADCQLPPAPSKVPDGASASEPEMIAAMQTLKAYDGDVNVYLKCLEFEERQNHMTAQQRDTQHNAAITQLQKVADKFNEQVRAFKSKHS